jgi:SAM-dependent methyltransferase
VRLFGEALTTLGRPPTDQRVFDLGAGNGAGGEQLRSLGVGRVVGLDLEPVAREAALRDRPGDYDHYLVGDLGTLPREEVSVLRDERFTAVLALAAIGVGHIPWPVLDRALSLLRPGGLFGFAVTPALLPGSDDADGVRSGYPDYFATLFDDRADELARHAYVHRHQTDGTPHGAVALVGRLR